ncbi:PaaI family thioesterase [Nocardia sp. alder85J]|uniref:PaaI family thioesterase n=1 Tax=Nocardia sp. alder85J TaxID=2862949 RepID=UPI001CD578A1|nr:PaaI family thioesterase [Nocardia sp. alder85J]MCX4091555.1 PaaI family thioesterase [Nocardia sp. alder85J]
MTHTPTFDRAFAAFARFATETPDYDKLREIADAAVPFGVFAGMRTTELDADHAVTEIPNSPDLRNHLQTVHAAALYLAADIACALAFVGAAAPQIGQVEWTVVRDSRSVYFKPAVGRIRAVGTVDERAIRSILTRTDQRRFDVDAKAMLYDDNDVLVAKMSFDYVAQFAALPAESV